MRWVLLGLLLSAIACGSTSGTDVSPSNVAGIAPLVRTSIGLELRLIAAGEFEMGSGDGPINERPRHTVRLTRPYYMGTTEVTQQQFLAFVTDTGYVTTAERSGGAKVWRDGRWIMDPDANHRNVFPGSSRPVVAVSYFDAVAFCDWLTKNERMAGTISAAGEIRLPTEAEWEHAATTLQRTPWSGAERFEDLCVYANVPDTSANRAGLGRKFVPCDDGISLETAPVAHYRPNSFGLYDMSGNVWEWTQDRLGAYPSSLQVDPRGPESGEERVMRGGSWSGELHGLRVSHRDGYPPELRGGAIGFRAVLVDELPTRRHESAH